VSRQQNVQDHIDRAALLFYLTRQIPDHSRNALCYYLDGSVIAILCCRARPRWKAPHSAPPQIGSVETIKLPLMAYHFTKHRNVSIRIVVMPFAVQFLQSQAAEQPSLVSLFDLPGVDGIYQDPDEWTRWWIRGDKILRIELRRWNCRCRQMACPRS
jgi:hypothetical protein